MNHTIDPGEVLVIYKVQRDRKVLARDFKGRELCLSKRNWKVKVISDISQQEYDTLVNVPSRYFRVLHDIRSFRLFAGDILLFMTDPPQPPNARNLRCCLVSCTDQVCLDLPANLKGTFQALPNYGLISMERVMTECSLPVKVSLEDEEEETTPIINVQIDREIEEDTVFAISPSKNSILLFPKSLNIAVAQLMPQHEFVSSKGLEYTQVLRTIENDQVLQKAIRGDSVYFTNEPIRCYRFQKLLFPSFPAEKKDKRERIKEELIPEATSESYLRRQKAVFTSESNQPCSFSEKPVPPLPAKTKNATVKQYQVTAKNNEVQHTESKQESEKQENSKQARSTQEASHNLGFLVQHKSHANTWAATIGTSTLAPREKTEMNSSGREKLETESDDNVFSACEPQRGVNANSGTVNSGTLSVRVRKGALANHLQPKQSRCNKPCWLAEVNTTANKTKNTTKGKEPSTKKHSDSTFEQRESDERGETQLTPDLFVSTQNDFSPTWQDKSFVSCRKAYQKELKVIKSSESSAELSEEDNEDSDCTDFSILEKQEAFKQNIPERNEEQSKPVDRGVNQGDPAVGNIKMYRTNEDNSKKRLFHSLTRRPRWFWQEAGKPAKKEKRQESSKSEAVRISPRNAASCEDLWISSPKEDDFECMSSITKYLETKEKLTRALVTINSLEMKGWESADTMTDNTNEYSQGKPVSDEDRKDSKKKENVAKPDKDLEDRHDISTKTTHVQSPTIFSREILSEETSESLTPVTHYSQPKCDSEANEGIPYNLHGCSTSYEDADSYVLMLPSFGSDRHMEWHRKDRGVEDGADEQETCSCTRNLGVFGGQLSESAAKRKIKEAILKMEWTGEEWAELTDAVRCNGRKRAFPPYVNLLSNGSNRCISKDQIFIDTSRNLNRSMRRAMPPYINIPKTEGMQGVEQHTGQGFVNDVQRLANLSLGKPPIPTPRSGRSSV